MKKVFTFLFVISGYLLFASQGREMWSDITASQAQLSGEPMIKTVSCRFLQLDLMAIDSYLKTAPMQFTQAVNEKIVELDIPMPDGTFQRFRIVESPVCHPDLAAKFPETRTWSGQGIDDLTATVRLDVTPFGFHAMILSSNGNVFIDPYNMQTTDIYKCYYKQDARKDNMSAACGFNPEDEWNKKQSEELHAISASHHDEARSAGETLRTYSLAMAATGEYTAFHGGNVSGAHAAIVTSVNRLSGVYEKELAISFQLVANNDTLIFTNGATDPYSNNNGGAMLAENQTTVTNRIGVNGYDVGHVFSTGGGGIAGLGVVCQNTQKARGVTGSPAPVGDPFDIDYVAHEVGHQFGARHTFNSETSACCCGNRSFATAYEPGSGITIMAYAGICASDNLANNSIAYFHTVSFDEIQDYTTFASGSICPTSTPTNNNAPTSALTDYDFDIPLNTPFVLTGAGSDPDGHPITYSFEQFDLGPAGIWSAPSGGAPIFKPYVPHTENYRLFPKLSNIVNNVLPTNVLSKGELKPTYARTLNFRMTLRDNQNLGGGVTYDDAPIQVTVVNTPGPFAITAPNTAGITWTVGTSQTITWNVVNTDVAPINSPNVNIYLSTTGGSVYPFPVTIATNVPNTGSYTFTVPNNPTTTARILVQGADNIFFDINDANFTIDGTIGVDEASGLESVNIIPNPASDKIQLIVSGPARGKVEGGIYDVSGRLVASLNYIKNAEGMIQDIDITSLTAGSYRINLTTEKGNLTKQFIKQ